MEEQIIHLLKESINNQFFIPILGISIILVIIKSKVDYKKYQRDCVIFNQKPKLMGYIQNSIINIVGIMTLTIIGFAGYTGLIHSNEFEEQYTNNINKDKTKETSKKNEVKNEIVKSKETREVEKKAEVKSIPLKFINPEKMEIKNKQVTMNELKKENAELKRKNRELKNLKHEYKYYNKEKLIKENERLKRDITILINQNDKLTAQLESN